MPRPKRDPNAPKREHIFPATVVTALVVKWKELTEAGKEPEAQEVLVEIIGQSRNMFMRLAQYEGYHHTVDLESLVNKANSMVVKWITHWCPKKGELFSWLSKCAKNAFLAEVVRASQYSKKYYSTDDSFERFIGAEDHQVEKDESSRELLEKIHSICSRWADPQMRSCIRFHIECISDNPTASKKNVILGGAYLSGMPVELSKWCYQWSVVALREAIYEKVSARLTDQDIFRLTHTYTYLPDMLNIITWDQMVRLMGIFGGSRIKIPPLVSIMKSRERYQIQKDIETSDLDPDAVAAIGKSHGVSQRSAQEIYEEMGATLNGDNMGEHEIFDSDDREDHGYDDED